MQKRTLTAAVVGAATLLATAVAVESASAAPATTAIPRSKPAWIATAQHLGAARADATVRARVYLAPRGGLSSLAQAARQASATRSFLTPAQYRARFAPTASTLSAVRSYLASAGLRVTSVAAGSRYLAVAGTVAAAERAFGAQIERYRHAGLAVQAPASALTVPARLAASVLTVTGLDTSPSLAKPAGRPAPPPGAGFRNARPCSTYYGEIPATYKADGTTKLPAFNGETLPYAPCGYTGPQFRSAYEGGTTLTGAGVTVAITDAYASPTIAADASRYAKAHGDPAYAAGQLTQTVAGKFGSIKKCDASGWYGEETLDVEAVHAMAPGANIHYYGAASCNDSDLLDSLGQVVDDDTAQIVTNSWSSVELAETATSVAAYEAVFLQGATEGISFLFSSGDNGDEVASTGVKQVDYPASDPYVTAVGGTTTAIGADGSLMWETGWGTDKYTLSADGASWSSVGYLYGSGGGASAIFPAPDYQAGVTGSTHRQVPDVAMDADPTTGMLVGQTQTFSDGAYYDEYRIGGTSLASPLFAGLTALAIEHSGKGVGLLNPVIYSHAATFSDVKGTPADAGAIRVDYANGENASGGLLYSVRTFNQDSSLTVTDGYDQVTGLGSPSPGWLTALG